MNDLMRSKLSRADGSIPIWAECVSGGVVSCLIICQTTEHTRHSNLMTDFFPHASTLSDMFHIYLYDQLPINVLDPLV